MLFFKLLFFATFVIGAQLFQSHGDELHDRVLCDHCPPGTPCDPVFGICGEGKADQLACQYNEDCPTDKLCDRLNRICINPCLADICGENADCITKKHLAECRCPPGSLGNPYLSCTRVIGCQSDEQCMANETCIEGKCSNLCDCGPNAVCDGLHHRGSCNCLPGYTGNPKEGCEPPQGADCHQNPCDPNSACKVMQNSTICFCSPEYDGDPPIEPCHPPKHPCQPSPCGPNTQCTVTNGGFAKCTCLPGYMKSLSNTHRGCIEKFTSHPTSTFSPGTLLDTNGEGTSLECTTDEDCASNKACIRYQCLDPCPGSCGIRAICSIEKHRPICTCSQTLTGNPLVRCDEPVPLEEDPEHNPCSPYPCGPNTYCKIDLPTEEAVCSCIENLVGDPKKGCKLECILNSDCPSDQVCLGYQCKNPCGTNNVCGLNAVCLCHDHVPTCICKEGFNGNPYVHCYSKLQNPSYLNSTLPCTPNPCDSSTQCQVFDSLFAVCDPCHGANGHYNPLCVPECLYNSDCPFNLACLNQKCLDPCSGSCGINAYCTVIYHTPVCFCPENMTGNPYENCSPSTTYSSQLTDLCHQNICGPNTSCKNTLSHNSCECSRGHFGNPYLVCQPECVINTDCPQSKVCLNHKCMNPCHRACGVDAQCQVINHQPNCFCPREFTGNPYINCYPNREYLPPVPKGTPDNPCDPSPCGPNSRCLISQQGYATCFCLFNYHGSPPSCKPECIVSAECSLTLTCINQKCVDPCHATCGVGATCFVVNHNPICDCPPNSIGDPLVACTFLPPIDSSIKTHLNPCDPTPCGPKSICQLQDGYPVCSCMANYYGSPPYCRPECTMNSECSPNEACVNGKCENPCTQSCGLYAKCDIVNHKPYCTCLPGYEGDAFVNCSKKIINVPQLVLKDPCDPSPCRENAQCTVYNNTVRCLCNPPYIGNPYTGACHLVECVTNSDCPSNMACLSSQCGDPCPGVCGILAQCTVVNHIPTCTCLPGHVGNPFQLCRRETVAFSTIVPEIINPCYPSPCGVNAECNNKTAPICRCLPGFFGDPYIRCDQECESNQDCDLIHACIEHKCLDPCPGTCGIDAQCTISNHIPVCSCPFNYTGDPFSYCKPAQSTLKPHLKNLCYQSPCGPYSQCHQVNDSAICICLPNYVGSPPNCKPECLMNSECPSQYACINQRCQDPCPSSCGIDANCHILNHVPICTCNEGYTGDPFSICTQIQTEVSLQVNLCNPSPCGPNSKCMEHDSHAVCSCLPDYQGSPPDCRPQCVINAECPPNHSCHKFKCVDLCPEICGINAQCKIVHHRPVCSCLVGYTGDPFQSCYSINVSEPTTPLDPCTPSPCGLYSDCQIVGAEAVCSCKEDYIGLPPNCRSECIVNSDCPTISACILGKCQDPCQNSCGSNSRCYVQNHIPTCSCLPEYTGDPFIQCSIIVITELPSTFDLCHPTPCGANAICSNGVCSCLPNYFGDPVIGCSTECLRSSDCDHNRTCIEKRCVDPCPGICGKHAKCDVVNNIPICSCPPQTTGDAFIACQDIIVEGSNRAVFLPPDEIIVSCQSQGVQIQIKISERGFDGILYVKGHSNKEECRKHLFLPEDKYFVTEIFKVTFGSCSMIYSNGQASFLLVVQKHPKLVTYKAQIYNIKCVYAASEQNITIGFNVSMLTTSGTIANTGLPPMCVMKIITKGGQEIGSAEIGENLLLQVNVEPANTYGGLARSCVAKTLDNNIVNEYTVTDENGCATDPAIFGEWQYNLESQSLTAEFNAFKFPNSDNIKFQCNIRVCFGRCQPVNCRAYDAYGKRRKRHLTNSTELDILSHEEIIIESNVIFTTDSREERLVNPTEEPQTSKPDDICISIIGLIIGLVITALLSLVFIALLVSCWLMIYRGEPPQHNGPLYHPSEFPNPIFRHNQQLLSSS